MSTRLFYRQMVMPSGDIAARVLVETNGGTCHAAAAYWRGSASFRTIPMRNAQNEVTPPPHGWIELDDDTAQTLTFDDLQVSPELRQALSSRT